MNKLSVVILFCFLSQIICAQTTFKKFDDPALNGQIESIIFDSGKEFNIQENNPFNKLDFEQKKKAKDGSIIYRASRSQFNQLRGNGKIISNEENNGIEYLEARSHAFVSQSGDRAVVSYNICLYGSEGDPSDEDRVSTIYVLDTKGNIANRFENIPSDTFEPVLLLMVNTLLIAMGSVWHTQDEI